MKKIISGILAFTLCMSMLCGCQEVESSSVQTPMTTTTPSVSGDTSSPSEQSTNAVTDQSGQPATSTSSQTGDTSFLEITMKEWDQMNTDSKYINMESILKYITDSGVTTSLDVVDLVTALDQSGNTSKKKTAYDLALKEINNNNKKS